MNIAIILASGSGSRIKQSKIPKQFIEISNKPIVIHTMERFLSNKNIDKIIVSCHPEWIDYLSKYVKDNYTSGRINIIKGGKQRNDSIGNAIKFVHDNNIACDDDVILTHDAVRMFVSDRIINENIDVCKRYGAVDTVVKTIDTIVLSSDGKNIDSIPERDYLYNSQTPQSFRYKILKDIYLSNKIKNTTDACRLLLEKHDCIIGMVIGEYENFKITNDVDLEFVNFYYSKTINTK